MSLSFSAVAEQASLTSFINCYLNEVDSGRWHSTTTQECMCPETITGEYAIELQLKTSQQQLLLDVKYRSDVGRHHFYNVYSRPAFKNAEWKKNDYCTVMLCIVNEIFDTQSISLKENDTSALDKLYKNKLQLMQSALSSIEQISQYLQLRHKDTSLNQLNFIQTEQTSFFGHWLHPTPKSRQGIAWWQQPIYSPELQGEFKLHYFSVNKALVFEGSVLDQKTSDIIKSELPSTCSADISTDHILIPAHPLQAHYLVEQDSVKRLMASGDICYKGAMGKNFTPTSSVRTLFSTDSEWMYKFSIPVRITNSLRSNMRDELEDGMAVDVYLNKSGFLNKRKDFKILDDPGFITVNLPDKKETESGFEFVLRRNPFHGDKTQGICSILSLAQDPIDIDGCKLQTSLLQQIIENLSQTEGKSLEQSAINWFNRYWRCSIESLIYLFDEHGISLEAHQQNSLMDVSDGYPSCYYYRDNQGFYLSKKYSDKLDAIDNMLTMSEMYYDDDEIFEAFGYYIFCNQLFSIIYRLGHDGLVSEKTLIDIVKSQLIKLKASMTGSGKGLIDYLLHKDQLACKTNLMARVKNLDETHQNVDKYIYMPIKNPLYIKPELGQKNTLIKEDNYNAA